VIERRRRDLVELLARLCHRDCAFRRALMSR